MTPPEIRLWLRLRAPASGQPRFRRQHPVGRYTLDFCCVAARLAVELDGWGHNMGDTPERDERRDAWLSSRGFFILRIAAAEAMANPDEVADGVVRTAFARIHGV